jgi:3-hydroxy-3-methylglutaryl CoA synthase
MEIYFPSTYVSQSDLEVFNKVPKGKYTIGLGQLNMACVNDREDINSKNISAVKKSYAKSKFRARYKALIEKEKIQFSKSSLQRKNQGKW